MIRKEFQIAGFEFPVVVHRHKDWSGSAIIEWFDKSNQIYRTVEIPAEIFLFVSIEETKRFVLAELGRIVGNIQTPGGST